VDGIVEGRQEMSSIGATPRLNQPRRRAQKKRDCRLSRLLFEKRGGKMKEPDDLMVDPGDRHSRRPDHGHGAEIDLCDPAIDATGSNTMRPPLAVFLVGTLSMTTVPLARLTGDLLSAVLIDLVVFVTLCGLFTERRRPPANTGRTR
jgi:hypothetical protein